MLVPSSSIFTAAHHVPSIVGTGNTLMYPPPSVSSQMGKLCFFFRSPLSLSISTNSAIDCEKWECMTSIELNVHERWHERCHWLLCTLLKQHTFVLMNSSPFLLWLSPQLRSHLHFSLSSFQFSSFFPFFATILFTAPMLTANYPPPTVGFMNPSILAAGGTLRRPRVEYDSTPPRILSKIDIDPHYYYGWPLASNKLATTSLTSANVTAATTHSNPIAINSAAQKSIERVTTPTLSLSSSPVASLTKQMKKPQQQQQSSSSDEHNNKNTVVLCPPSRTYCF